MLSRVSFLFVVFIGCCFFATSCRKHKGGVVHLVPDSATSLFREDKGVLLVFTEDEKELSFLGVSIDGSAVKVNNFKEGFVYAFVDDERIYLGSISDWGLSKEKLSEVPCCLELSSLVDKVTQLTRTAQTRKAKGSVREK